MAFKVQKTAKTKKKIKFPKNKYTNSQNDAFSIEKIQLLSFYQDDLIKIVNFSFF
jgi:hypothetical protein